ncbi:MAG: hypothetical protein QM635_08690 [Microbacteriaceae bacterium]
MYFIDQSTGMTRDIICLGAGFGVLAGAYAVLVWASARSKSLCAEIVVLIAVALLISYAYLPLSWIPTPGRVAVALHLIDGTTGDRSYLLLVCVLLGVAALVTVIAWGTGLVSRVSRIYESREPPVSDTRR